MMEMVLMIAIIACFVVVAIRFALMGNAEEQRRKERIEFEKNLARIRKELEEKENGKALN